LGESLKAPVPMCEGAVQRVTSNLLHTVYIHNFNAVQRFRSTTYGLISNNFDTRISLTLASPTDRVCLSAERFKVYVPTNRTRRLLVHDWMRWCATCPFAVLETIRPVRHPASTRDAA
jgi:hypothetical protein